MNKRREVPNGWSTDFSKLPETGRRVIVQYLSADVLVFFNLQELKRLKPWEHDGIGYVAWHPEPEPYKPAKPEQISPEEAYKYRMAQIVEEASPAMRISGWKTPMQKLIKEVEERTREIVAWEQKCEVEK